MKTSRLPPVTIRLKADQRWIAQASLVSEIKSQLGLRPRNAAERASYESSPCTRYPFCSNEHQHSTWSDVGDFRDDLMAGIARPPSPTVVATISARRAALTELKMRLLTAPLATDEDLVVLRRSVELLSSDFQHDKQALEAVRLEARQLVCDRIEALLRDDVATGRLVMRCMNDDYFVMLDKLMLWAAHRNIVIEQEPSDEVVLIHRIRAELESVRQQDKSAATPAEAPWLVKDPRDKEPEGFQGWYTPARFFAREAVRLDPSLLTNRDKLAKNVVKSLTAAGIFKRGNAKKPLDPATVKKAFVNVNLG